MNLKKLLSREQLILSEGAIVESLRRSVGINLHPTLEHSLLIYDTAARIAMEKLYAGYISVALEAERPILLFSPTWRANRERLENAAIEADVNGDAIEFMKSIREKYSAKKNNILLGGLIGCKNDCYKPEQGLSEEEAFAFHSWQIEKLAEAGVDFLIAQTLPAVPEARGIAKAMEQSGISYCISFVINRSGTILDGSSIKEAVTEIDSLCRRVADGYMINCSYPSFLPISGSGDQELDRLIGFMGNASSLDHYDLDQCETIQQTPISEWGDLMISLNKKLSVTVLGGCCGTTKEHLRYICDNIN